MTDLFRVLKSLTLALMTLFSLKALGFNWGQAFLGSLVPALLGIVDQLTATAFSIAAVIFIFAIALHVFSTPYQWIKDMALHPDRIEAAVRISGSNAQPNHSPEDSGSNSSTNNMSVGKY